MRDCDGDSGVTVVPKRNLEPSFILLELKYSEPQYIQEKLGISTICSHYNHRVNGHGLD